MKRKRVTKGQTVAKKKDVHIVYSDDQKVLPLPKGLLNIDVLTNYIHCYYHTAYY